MDELRTIAYILTAGGSCRGPHGIQVLYEKDNEIIEELLNGSKVQSETSVGYGIKTNAPMAFGISCSGDTEQSFVFSVDKNNKMKAFVFDTDEEEWEDYDLGDGAGKAELHAQSSLATDSSHDGLISVFFLNTNCKLQVLQQKLDGSWHCGPELAGASPRPGTPLSVVPTDDDTILVFYLGLDNTMHYLAHSLDSDRWQDHRWETVKVDEPVQRFKVSLDTESGHYEAFVLAKGRLLRFDGDGPRQEVGHMQGKEFIPSTTAQSVKRHAQ
ncbi:hypothetical protein CMQ_7954 [Grosmannia clavigera kw1407]|uniref:Fucose-specific lectin n=1 Tax=Grosmannia clavigera (strain kw1407 / UAMH 11150) TaxID=655863 RepID=F0XRW6_GROCL|nr:uncharacterized protein CMQ_7954 [Grosmannia clavigera kw1407]EFW99586.1 hypothetical protein CMQ_7954 [Grosmannia clavigera kw1407]